MALPKLTLLAVLSTAILAAQPIAVRQLEGEVRGFLVLRSLNGEIVADGDSVQTTKGGQITSRLTYHFKDGSTQEETVVFTQSGHSRVLSDRLVQKGPTFKHAMDMTIDANTGQVTVTQQDDKGQTKVETERMKMPPDLANGIVSVLLKNLPPGQQSATESMIVASPKPLIVKLVINSEGEDSFTTGTASHKSTRYKVHIDIGGIKGAIAPIVGKQPPDTRVWISDGVGPSFLKSEGVEFEGGPIWLNELVSPAWPPAISGSTESKRQPR